MGIEKGYFIIKCNKYKEEYIFREGMVDFDISHGDERSMGTENVYIWEDNFNCSSCDNKISIKYEVCEYPQGTLNNVNIEVVGASYSSTFDFNFHSPEI
jgi:hypothetical protein